MINNSCPYYQVDRWCKKINANIDNMGCCEEGDYVAKESGQRKRKWNKYERKQRYKAKLEKLLEVDHMYPCPAYRVDKNRKYTNDRDSTLYIKREYRSNHVPGLNGYLKRLASRKFRRHKGQLANGCAYKKTFDYWWELI